MQQHFNEPVETVFNSLSQHATFNTVLWPVRFVRIKDAAPPEALDGVGSTRKMGFGPIKQPFQFFFWITVLANVGGIWWLLTSGEFYTWEALVQRLKAT